MKKHWKLLLITAALTGLLCLPAAAEEAHSGLYDITAAQTDVTVTPLGGKAETIEIDGETKNVYAGSTGLCLRYTAAEAGSEYVVFAVRDGDADPTEDNVVYLAQSSSGEFEIRPGQLEAGHYSLFLSGSNRFYQEAASFSYYAETPTRSLRFSMGDSLKRTYGDAGFTNAAVLDGSGDATIRYHSSDPAVAAVDAATGAVTIYGAGTAEITATAAAVPGVYAEVQAHYTLQVAPKELTASEVTLAEKHENGKTDGTVRQVTWSGLVGAEQLTLGVDYTAEVRYDDPYPQDPSPASVTLRLLDTPAARNYVQTGETVRASGRVTGDNPFTDVRSDSYCSDAVIWAVSREITAGMTASTFVPNASCTRAQMVTFLWRAMGKPMPRQTDNPFTDVKPGQYYYNAVLWAVEQGITNGTTANTFSPNATCNRGQIVTFLWRAAGSPAPTQEKNPFTDVQSGSYCYRAVLWAVENGVTKGYTAGEFRPYAPCTRGQGVTLLYRARQLMPDE